MKTNDKQEKPNIVKREERRKYKATKRLKRKER